MKTRKWPLLLMAILTVLSMSSCQDWGEADPPAGNQKLPAKPDTSAKLIAEFTFDEDFNSTATEGETPVSGEGFAYSADQEIPEIVQDDERESGVMHANGGYLRIPNPLIGADIQTGVSFSFFVKSTKTDHTGALISFSDGTNKLYFTANAFLSYTGTGGYLDVNDPEVSVTNAMPYGTWHYVALTFTEKGYAIYIDGTKKYDTNNHASISSGKTRAVSVGDFDYSNMIDLLSSATYIYLGYGSDTETAEAYYDDLKIWTNTFSDSDAQGPNIGGGIHVPDPVYKATFETTTGL
ncbi:LamG domain-containing protein [Bacteroides thetaiotaomicron]|nr:LamG domain-containing protein [Bacteroides thetaiotaomicron]